MTNNIFLWNKRIAPVSARMMTWEVTTAFDGMLTEMELQKRFDEDFQGVQSACDVNMGCSENRVLFWPLVSFNASDGRRHRYLVAIANEPLLPYRKKFDRCLPIQVTLYGIADKILREEQVDFVGVGYMENRAEIVSRNDGNLLFVTLWNKTLYILVFMKGRLCHWSEECGYGKSFDELCRDRIVHFKEFLQSDELFENAGVFDEVLANCDRMENQEELFRLGARDPFWRHLDLDVCESMKKCEKHRLTLVVVVATFLMLVFWLVFPLLEIGETPKLGLMNDVASVELDLPPSEIVDLLAWAKGHRDLIPAGWGGMRDGSKDGRKSCSLPDFKLLGIVGDRAVLVETSVSEKKILTMDDSLDSYRIKAIGRNNVVLRCGGKEVRYEVGAR